MHIVGAVRYEYAQELVWALVCKLNQGTELKTPGTRVAWTRMLCTQASSWSNRQRTDNAVFRMPLHLASRRRISTLRCRQWYITLACIMSKTQWFGQGLMRMLWICFLRNKCECKKAQEQTWPVGSQGLLSHVLALFWSTAISHPQTGMNEVALILVPFTLRCTPKLPELVLYH